MAKSVAIVSKNTYFRLFLSIILPYDTLMMLNCLTTLTIHAVFGAKWRQQRQHFARLLLILRSAPY